MSELQTRTLKFSNGRTIPVLGLGTWKSKPEEVKNAVKDAIEIGYRHIDTAFLYHNECAVGEAIKSCLDAGIVKRDELFVTTKLWNTFHRADLVANHFHESLSNLKLDYLDLYLIHWPMSLKEGGDLLPKNEAGEFLFSDAHYLDTWNEMEKLVDAGLIRSIGVSNFNSQQIQTLLDSNPKHKPVSLQVEISPYFPNTKLIQWAHAKGLVVTAYSPFGSPDRPWVKSSDKVLFNEARVKDVAKKHEKTTAQVIVRWGLQRDCVLIPKSVTRSRIMENSQIFDFKLTSDEMESIGSFEPCRSLSLAQYEQNQFYPFHADF